MNESENTFNTLSNKPLLTTSYWCRFGIHKWQKWSEIMQRHQKGSTVFLEDVQERYCGSCNTYQRKKI